MAIQKQTIKILNELGRRYFTSLLERFGVEYADRGGYVNAKCPVPSHTGDNDNPTAFSFRYDTGQWACWTHHCEDNYGRDIIGLVMAVKEIYFDKAVEWLKDFVEEQAQVSIDDIDINSINIEKKKPKHSLIIHKPLPDSMLDYLSPDVSYLTQREFDIEILQQHQVGTWRRFGTYMHERIVIPIRDAEGRLIGFTGRCILEEDEWQKKYNAHNDPKIKYAKWLHGRSYVKKDDDFHKTSIVFNMHNIVSESYKKIILVEGPLDGFKLEMAGIPNWGACLGSSVSPIQQHILLQAGIKEVALAFDPDDAGKVCTRKAIELMKSNFDIIRTINVPAPYDVGSLSVPTLQRLINEKHYI